MVRTRRVFAPSFVVTMSLLPGCEKKAQEPETPPPAPAAAPIVDDKIKFDGYTCTKGPPGGENSVPCPEDLLPVPKPGTAVASLYGTFRTVGRRQVRGPATIVLPMQHKVSGKTHVAIDEGTFRCREWEDYQCPPQTRCNPPEPRELDCPDDLLPRLAPGVEPSSRKDGACFLDDNVKVVCPK